MLAQENLAAMLPQGSGKVFNSGETLRQYCFRQKVVTETCCRQGCGKTPAGSQGMGRYQQSSTGIHSKAVLYSKGPEIPHKSLSHGLACSCQMPRSSLKSHPSHSHIDRLLDIIPQRPEKIVEQHRREDQTLDLPAVDFKRPHEDTEPLHQLTECALDCLPGPKGLSLHCYVSKHLRCMDGVECMDGAFGLLRRNSSFSQRNHLQGESLAPAPEALLVALH